jgi:hypothetical protein
MKSTRKPQKPLPAEVIAPLAERGRDVSRFFTNAGKMMKPIQRVNVDLTPEMLQELDRAAQELNISRQAVIKTLIRQALDQQYMAEGLEHWPSKVRVGEARGAERFRVHLSSALRSHSPRLAPASYVLWQKSSSAAVGEAAFRASSYIKRNSPSWVS